MLTKINEGKAEVYVPVKRKISRDLEVFYNPLMELNRTLSVLLLNAVNKNSMQIALPLAGSGVRGIRFFLELNKKKIKMIYYNDHNKNAYAALKKNLALNNIGSGFVIENIDANEFLLRHKGFDYIDIDPFGSPNFLLNSAVVRIARNGILAVTATDTSALSGSYPSAGLRKYYAMTLRNELKHEIGLRVLIRKCQLIGAQFEKAMIPVLSYSKDHYMRVFFYCIKSKRACDDLLREHKYLLYCRNCLNRKASLFNKDRCSCGFEYEYAGPIFAGRLQDKNILKKMIQNADANAKNFLEMLYSELDVPYLFDIDEICSKYKVSMVPRRKNILEKIKKKGYSVSDTHFLKRGFKSNIKVKELVCLLK